MNEDLKMKFQVITSDPPWSFDDRLQKMKSTTRRSAVSQYQTMTLDEICSIKVNEIADPAGCVLALWVPSALLTHGIKVMDAWGFTLKGNIVWVKTKKPMAEKKWVKWLKSLVSPPDLNDSLAFGMGRMFRQAHEIALIGTSGKSVYPLLQDHSQRSVIMAPNLGHSRKPEELQDRLDKMFPEAQKLEMFARRVRNGYTCLGNQIDGQDIRDAVERLIVL